MMITAPNDWLDLVDTKSLRNWFLDEGYAPAESAPWRLERGESQVCLDEQHRFSDWRSRLLEVIQEAALIQGITVAEWFIDNVPIRKPTVTHS